MARIEAVSPPYDDELATMFRRLMGGDGPPLLMFRVLAHNMKVLDKLRSTGSYLLNFGVVPPRDREIVILRTTALCGCEYEWGVHVTVFSGMVGLSSSEVAATRHGDASAWSARDALLIRMCDELHETSRVSEPLWASMAAEWTSAELIELLAIAGQYHLVSYMLNGLDVEPEETMARW
jgi:alkylhydroperoxidase family enzyme